MFSADDLMDLCADAVTRGPDDPVPVPLFEALPVGERVTVVDELRRPVGVAQKFLVTDVGNFKITVEEVGY